MGFLVYQYAQYLPLPSHWHARWMGLVYRVAGSLFRGERHYELWLRRDEVPCPEEAPRDAVGRRRILVIDRYVPQPDRDAGSRSMWCVLRALQHMGFAVTFWPRDLLYDPQYVLMLEREGIQVLWGKSFEGRFAAWMARHGAVFDAVFLSRPLVAREFLPAVRRHSQAAVLFYGHDLHHARLQREYALTGAWPLRWESAFMKRVEHALWRAVDVTYYPSSDETAEVRRTVAAAQAFTLPLYFFDEPAPAFEAAGDRDGIVFVAGFAHGPNVDAAKWLVADIMPRVWCRVSGARLWLVGASPALGVRALAGPQVSVTGFVSDDELVRFYRAARVAVVPLRVGAGMKGKVVEALHHGIPLVTTPVGAQGLDALPHNVPVSADPAVLADEIVALLSDDARWREASVAERDYARERFSRETMIEVLALGMAASRGA